MNMAAKRVMLAILLALTLTRSDAAQEEEAHHRFLGDVFWAGREIRLTDPDIEDVFAAGENVTLESAVRESVHAAGRNIRILGAVGQEVYAAGFDVDVSSAVTGDITAAGYNVELAAAGSAGEDILMAGQNVVIRGAVGGDAVLSGNIVEIAAPITGSVEVRARELRFAQGARIDGTLAYRTDNPVTIPAAVIPPERVVGEVVEREAQGPVGIMGWLVGGVVIIVLTLLFAALFGFLFPRTLQKTRATLAERPWRTLGLGVVATSALFGSLLVLAVSLIGIPLLPLVLIGIPLALVGGYLTAAHAIGSMLVARLRGRTSGPAAVGAILVGILVLWAVGLIPILGWVIAVAAVVIGLGAWFSLAIIPRAAATAP
jgi:hypothetical protein